MRVGARHHAPMRATLQGMLERRAWGRDRRSGVDRRKEPGESQIAGVMLSLYGERRSGEERRSGVDRRNATPRAPLRMRRR